jgi:hypothetical protein
MVLLRDGEGVHVTRVCVMSLVKDAADWLTYARPRLEQLHALHPDTRFFYCFYENDSTDDTLELLRAFCADGWRGVVYSEHREPYVNQGINYDRTKSIGDMRNRLLELALADGHLAGAEYCMMLDTNIFFSPVVVQQLLLEAKADVVMVTPYTSEIVPVEALRARGVVIEGADPVVSFNHYYDTFAFATIDGRNTWPKCVFEQCRVCKVDRVKAVQEVLDVRSAFGGLCVVRAAPLRDHPCVRWSTFEFAGRFALCEHVGFCDSLRAATRGGRVVVATRVTDVRWLG